MKDLTIVHRLAETIEIRKNFDSDSSYVAKLLCGGRDEILKKIAEETAEVLLASKDGDKLQITRETADLWFHSLILLAHHGLGPDDVLDELERREGISGIDEKASRKTG
ncbi:MAG: phosphoribosyl-ATP diphosphatase [Nitrosomonadaceae bacterium]